MIDLCTTLCVYTSSSHGGNHSYCQYRVSADGYVYILTTLQRQREGCNIAALMHLLCWKPSGICFRALGPRPKTKDRLKICRLYMSEETLICALAYKKVLLPSSMHPPYGGTKIYGFSLVSCTFVHDAHDRAAYFSLILFI